MGVYVCSHVITSDTPVKPFAFVKTNYTHRIPGPVLSMIAWIPEPVIKYPGINGGCDYRDKAHWWAYISCVLQAIFDLMVFLLCTVKVSNTDIIQY